MIIVRGSRKYSFLKYGRKIRVEFLEMLEASILMDSSFRQFFQIYSEVCIFCSVIQYKASKKQPVGSTLEVLVESLEIPLMKLTL